MRDSWHSRLLPRRLYAVQWKDSRSRSYSSKLNGESIRKSKYSKGDLQITEGLG